jgi:hypothetical protein
MYVSVRGWIELAHEQRGEVERIIDADRNHYSTGWAFPAKPFNWTLYVFYGGDIREQDVPWLRHRVDRIAALDPVDEDGDLPAGFFLLDDERQHPVGWTIRDGRVTESPAPAELRWFAERP